MNGEYHYGNGKPTWIDASKPWNSMGSMAVSITAMGTYLASSSDASKPWNSMGSMAVSITAMGSLPGATRRRQLEPWNSITAMEGY
jgi:hypothetical protein